MRRYQTIVTVSADDIEIYRRAFYGRSMDEARSRAYAHVKNPRFDARITGALAHSGMPADAYLTCMFIEGGRNG